MGNPARLIGGAGRENDITRAHDLVEGFDADATIADKGYDADHLHEKITGRGGQIVIPPKRNRKVQRACDAELYKERNLIERFFNKLKQFRRVATRYDKLLANFMGFVKIAAIAIWLKWLSRHHDPGNQPNRRLDFIERVRPKIARRITPGHAAQRPEGVIRGVRRIDARSRAASASQAGRVQGAGFGQFVAIVYSR